MSKEEKEYLVFFITTPSKKEAVDLSKELISKRLIACGNIIPNITSIYRWKKNIEESEEVLLLIKTTEDKSKKVIEFIEKTHSYETPECVGIKIEEGSNKYLEWIKRVTTTK